MKKLIYFLTLPLLFSCAKEGLDTYDNASSKSSIYFSLAETTNRVDLSFGYANAIVSDSLLTLVVNTIGEPVDYDRPYQLIFDENSTMQENVDFSILEQPVIQKGKVRDTLLLNFKRTAKISKDSIFLFLNIQPNEHFTNNFYSKNYLVGNTQQTRYFTKMTIKLDDIAGAPPFWSPGNISYSLVTGYLGTFSKKKLQLLMTLFGANIDELLDPDWGRNNLSKIFAWSSGLKSYLTRQAGAGNTVYEEDGVTPMNTGPYTN